MSCDLLLHLVRGHRGHAGQAAEALRHVGGGVAEHGELQVVHPRLGDHVEAPEGEEQVRLHALAQCGVGEDQAGVGHVQVALGADDGELAAFGRRRHRSRGRSAARCRWWSWRFLLSHAAAGLGQAGDVGHLLGRLAGEQGEQLLDRDAGQRGHPAQRGGLAVRRVVVAQEPDRLPVRVGQLDADLRRRVARPGPRPIRRTRSGSLRRRRGPRRCRSVATGMVSPPSSGWCLPAMDMWAGSGSRRPGSSRCQ